MEVGDFTPRELPRHNPHGDRALATTRATKNGPQVMSPQPRTIVSGLSYPACPRWHDARLWFSDMGSPRHVATVEDGGDPIVVVQVPEAPGGLAFLPDGTVLIVSMEDRRLMKLVDGELEVVADLGGVATWYANDMVVDRFGRAYVGNFGFDFLGGADPVDAVLALVHPDGRVEPVADGIKFANGMVITPDGLTLVIAETLGGRLTAFDIRPDGKLSGRRTFAELPDFSPDGMCLDQEGAVWVGSIFSNEFIRIEDGGSVTDRIEVPGRWAVGCTLGGVDGRTLYMCTVESSMEQMRENESAGYIEAVDVDVPGAAHTQD